MCNALEHGLRISRPFQTGQRDPLLCATVLVGSAGRKKVGPPPKAKHSGTRGALIKGMSRRLPSQILDSEVFRERLRKLLRHYSGIYALYKGDRLYYVGLTYDLLGRINHHRDDRHRKKWDSFVVFRIKRISFLKDVETLVTNLARTPGNRVKGNIPRDGDINRLLRSTLSEHEGEMRAIKKALKHP